MDSRKPTQRKWGYIKESTDVGAVPKGTATLQTKTTSSTGAYKFVLKIKKKTTVQVTYAGTASCPASASAKKKIKVT